MIRFDSSPEWLERLPLTAALGHIYTHRLTGVLQVHDIAGSVPFVFWFKRGFPCFSYSRDGLNRLGELFGDRDSRTPLILRLLERPARDCCSNNQLAGQRLLGESLVTLDELQQLLSRQIAARLLCCAALPDALFRFEEGMDQFGLVPLSSPLVNPVEVAARAALSAPQERVRRYLIEAVECSHVRLAPGRRIPPMLKAALSAPFLDSLVEPQEFARSVEVPSRLRTLCFLHSFGFLEQLNDQPTPVVTSEQTRPASAPADHDLLAMLAQTAAADASHYRLLDLPFDASRTQVRQRYRALAFAIHPDRVPPQFQLLSRELFPRLVDAYHLLSKERLRTSYDRELLRRSGGRELGSPEQVARMVDSRREQLARAGLTTLAQEYACMLSTCAAPRPVNPGQDWWEARRAS